MNFSLPTSIGALLLAAALFGACSRLDSADRNDNSAVNHTTKTSDAAATKDDVEELGKIIKLPVAPEEATYRESGGNNDGNDAANEKKLTAVLKFSADGAARTVEQAEKIKPAVTVQVEAEDWFAAELIAQSQLSGDETLKGVEFAADEFFQAPYSAGKITRIGETNYFVLELAAR